MKGRGKENVAFGSCTKRAVGKDENGEVAKVGKRIGHRFEEINYMSNMQNASFQRTMQESAGINEATDIDKIIADFAS